MEVEENEGGVDECMEERCEENGVWRMWSEGKGVGGRACRWRELIYEENRRN